MLGEFLDEQSKCYTLEVSFFCYTDGATEKSLPYTTEKCKNASFTCAYTTVDKELGKNVVLTFVDYYNLHPLLPNSATLRKMGSTSADTFTTALRSSMKALASSLTGCS